MITQEQAEYLVSLPKYLVQDEAYLERFAYSPKPPIDDRWYLASREEEDILFFLDIFQSSKKLLKLTLHFQEDEASIGLLRVDFNGRHHNPETVTDKVPDKFKPYAGQWIEESHIHYFVEGYKPLAWALPLTADETFAIKTFDDVSAIGEVLNELGKKINLKTGLTVTIQTVLL